MQKFIILFPSNLVKSRVPQTAFRYLKNCRTSLKVCKTLLFYKNWQHCKLATVSIFKISLIDPPIGPFYRRMSYFGIIRILKKILTDREGHLKFKNLRTSKFWPTLSQGVISYLRSGLKMFLYKKECIIQCELRKVWNKSDPFAGSTSLAL